MDPTIVVIEGMLISIVILCIICIFYLIGIKTI